MRSCESFLNYTKIAESRPSKHLAVHILTLLRSKVNSFFLINRKKSLNFCQKHAIFRIFAEWKQNILLKNSFFALSAAHRASKSAARKASSAKRAASSSF